jgi:hypothetical protein
MKNAASGRYEIREGGKMKNKGNHTWSSAGEGRLALSYIVAVVRYEWEGCSRALQILLATIARKGEICREETSVIAIHEILISR